MKEVITPQHEGMWVQILNQNAGGHGQLLGTIDRVNGDFIYIRAKGPNGQIEKVPTRNVKLWKAKNTMLGLKPKPVGTTPAPGSPAPIRASARQREIPVHPPAESVEVARKLDEHDAQEAAQGIPPEELLAALARSRDDLKAADEMLRETQVMERRRSRSRVLFTSSAPRRATQGGHFMKTTKRCTVCFVMACR